MIETYTAPTIGFDRTGMEESAIAPFVATIIIILAFFATVLAWCFFVCYSYGGLKSCEVGWFTAKATCKD